MWLWATWWLTWQPTEIRKHRRNSWGFPDIPGEGDGFSCNQAGEDSSDHNLENSCNLVRPGHAGNSESAASNRSLARQETSSKCSQHWMDLHFPRLVAQEPVVMWDLDLELPELVTCLSKPLWIQDRSSRLETWLYNILQKPIGLTFYLSLSFQMNICSLLLVIGFTLYYRTYVKRDIFSPFAGLWNCS